MKYRFYLIISDLGVPLFVKRALLVYSETFATTSNDFGLVNLEIGTGLTNDDFTAIDWAILYGNCD
jgi:hypothetical protein